MTILTSPDGGWKEARVDCGIGARCRFRIGDQAVPDPASRLQSGGVHGWNCASVFPAPTWIGRAWEETVLYECRARLMGGFKDIVEKLPILAGLGVIASAHAKDMMIFLDVVYSHFGPDGNHLPLYAKPFLRILLVVRRDHVMSLIRNARSTDVRAIGEKAVGVQWDGKEGQSLPIAGNRDSKTVSVPPPPTGMIWGGASRDELPPFSTYAWARP